ncbi:MAG: Flp pilus assembly complex ATPase component TadA [Lentisphaerae bacterium]|nr:Flp pilus assembly complex ATPase component TadA [Lentisphaerota bacterium]
MSSLRLGDILLNSGVISTSELDLALEQQRGTDQFLGDVLLEMGYVSPGDIARALAVQLDIPFIELGDAYQLRAEEVQLVPESVARRFCLVPLKKESASAVTVVMRDPLDIEALDAVRSLTQMEVIKAVSTEDRILAAIDKFYRADAHLEHDLKGIADLEAETSAIEGEAEAGRDAGQLMVEANDAPVVRFVNLILMQAVRDGASDIHFEPGEQDVTVRLRVDGVLQEVTPPSKGLYQAVVTRIKILSNMDIAEHRLPLDGRFKFSAYRRVIDVRVSSLPEIHGEKMVLRILDRDSLKVDMTEIGFDQAMLDDFRQVLKLPNGIVLLTGPTGSGKTTTLYSALSYLRSPEKNIQTVEDPVEYQLAKINQMQIRPLINLDFANALRSILRQDPDIIMIGEMRDEETARIAMRAALTGHLVLSTLHTNDSPSAFWRLRDIGIEPFLIAATIKLILSQRLVRVLCPECKTPVQPDEDVLSLLRPLRPDVDEWTFLDKVGCTKCNRRGFKGRSGVFEYLEVGDEVRQMIIDGVGEVELRQGAQRLGMEPLLMNGLHRVQRGITTVTELLGACPLSIGNGG